MDLHDLLRLTIIGSMQFKENLVHLETHQINLVIPAQAGIVRPTAHRNSEVQVLAGGNSNRPRTGTQLRRREAGWRAGGREMVARRITTNMIRPDGQASWRFKTKPAARDAGPCRGEGACKWHGLAIRWLMTGRCEVSVRGLGRPASKSGGMSTLAGARGIIVVMKPGNAGGAKGVRELDS